MVYFLVPPLMVSVDQGFHYMERDGRMWVDRGPSKINKERLLRPGSPRVRPQSGESFLLYQLSARWHLLPEEAG